MSIHTRMAPVRSRTASAGSSGSASPFEKATPSAYSRQYASTRVTRYSSLSDGWRATRSASLSYTPRSVSDSSISKVWMVAVSATELFPDLHACDQPGDDHVRVLDHLIGEDIARAVTDHLMDIDHDVSSRFRSIGSRADVGIDEPPLPYPVLAHSVVPMDVPALHSVGPGDVRMHRGQ